MKCSNMTKEQAAVELKKISEKYYSATNKVAILRADLEAKNALALTMEREGADDEEQDAIVFEIEDLEDEIDDLELEIEELEEQGDPLWNLVHDIKEE